MNMEQKHKRIEYTVRGRVQLVMFRDFAKRNADRLGIVGMVRNNEDGSVSVIGEGEEVALAAFSEALKKGPFLSRVDSVDVTNKDAAGEFSEFRIIYAR